MHFALIDRIVERDEQRLVAVKAVSLSEEYLQDHFPSFPVLPGVFMLEALVQAARAHLGEGGGRYVLGEVRAMKYGSFVRPGEVMRVEVVRVGERGEDGSVSYKGQAVRVGAGGADESEGPSVCVSGRLSLRPVRR